MTKFENAHRERERLAELTALRRPLTDSEQCEVLRLDERERRRATNRLWQRRNPELAAIRARRWREARA